MPPTNILSLLAMLLLTNSVVGAQTAKDLPLEEVTVTATRVEQASTEMSISTSVIDAADLDLISPVHVQQALSRVPGVSMHRGNGQESLPAIRSPVLTGAGACGGVLILEEGIAVRGAGFCNVNELFDTHFEQARRLEVIRGPNTSFYGSNALNGSVNVVLPSVGTNTLGVELGSFDYRRASAALQVASNETHAARLFVTLSDDGGYRDNAGYEQQKLSWRQNLELGDWQLDAGATYVNLDQETAGFVVGEDAYLNRSLSRMNDNPEAYRTTRSARAWLKARKPVFNSSEFYGALYARDTSMDFLQHFLPGDPLEQNAQTGVGLQSAVMTKLSDHTTWTVGFDAEMTDGQLRQTQDQPTQGSPFLMATIPSGVQYDYQVDAIQAAVFAHLDWRNGPWQTIAGARLETLQYDYNNLTLTGRTRDDGTECGFGGCRYSRPADRDDRFTHLSPKLELRYHVDENWRLSLTVADSFRAPQATELYRLQREQVVADLDVVDALSIEAGLRYRNENTELAVSMYARDSNNEIIRDSDFFNIDGQSIRSRGLEFSFRQPLNQQWRWRLVGSIADHEYSSDRILDGNNINGNQVDTAPKVFGSVFLDWRASDRLEVELEAQHMGSYYLNPENSAEYPGHSLVHARAVYDVNDQWRLSLRALNLGDKRYAKRADFTGFTGQRYFPGEPRSVFAELNFSF